MSIPLTVEEFTNVLNKNPEFPLVTGTFCTYTGHRLAGTRKCCGGCALTLMYYQTCTNLRLEDIEEDKAAQWACDRYGEAWVDEFVIGFDTSEELRQRYIKGDSAGRKVGAECRNAAEALGRLP